MRVATIRWRTPAAGMVVAGLIVAALAWLTLLTAWGRRCPPTPAGGAPPRAGRPGLVSWPARRSPTPGLPPHPWETPSEFAAGRRRRRVGRGGRADAVHVWPMIEELAAYSPARTQRRGRRRGRGGRAGRSRHASAARCRAGGGRIPGRRWDPRPCRRRRWRARTEARRPKALSRGSPVGASRGSLEPAGRSSALAAPEPVADTRLPARPHRPAQTARPHRAGQALPSGSAHLAEVALEEEGAARA